MIQNILQGVSLSYQMMGGTATTSNITFSDMYAVSQSQMQQYSTQLAPPAPPVPDKPEKAWLRWRIKEVLWEPN